MNRLFRCVFNKYLVTIVFFVATVFYCYAPIMPYVDLFINVLLAWIAGAMIYDFFVTHQPFSRDNVWGLAFTIWVVICSVVGGLTATGIKICIYVLIQTVFFVNVFRKQDLTRTFDLLATIIGLLGFVVNALSLILYFSRFYKVFANDVITVWLGKEYTFSMLTVIAVTVNTYFSCALQPLWIYRDATGLYMKTKYMMLTGAIVNIVLSVILGRFMGIAGIIFASAIARLSTYFWYEPKLLFHEYFNSRATGYYISILKNIGLLACVIAVLSYAFSGWVVTDWMTLILKVVVTGAVCSSIFVLAYCRTEGFQVIMNKVRQI